MTWSSPITDSRIRCNSGLSGRKSSTVHYVSGRWPADMAEWPQVGGKIAHAVRRGDLPCSYFFCGATRWVWLRPGGGALSTADAVGRECPPPVLDDPGGHNTQRVALRHPPRLEARNEMARRPAIVSVDDSIHEQRRNVRGRGFG